MDNNESILKKEFQKDDVSRLRNLITGKEHDKIKTGTGYSKTQNDYKEGDIWEENGKNWTIKNGIKESISKIDREKFIFPLFCPNCKKVMKGTHDKSFYKMHNKCHSCVVIMESDLRKNKKYEDYEKKLHNEDIDSKIKEFKDYIKSQVEESNKSFISENGEIEKWVGDVDIEKVDSFSKQVIDYLESLKK